jgi:hypothetical protein
MNPAIQNLAISLGAMQGRPLLLTEVSDKRWLTRLVFLVLSGAQDPL